MSTISTMIPAHSGGGQRRLLFHAAWALTAASFLSVGSMAVQSSDPYGPVSVLVHTDAPLMMLKVLALAAVTSAIATVLAGRDHPDAGAFAVGIGLALVALRGDSMTYLLMSKGADRNLCLRLIAEGLCWSAVMAVVFFTSALTVRWFGTGVFDGSSGSGSNTATPSGLLSTMAAAMVPGIRRMLFGESTERQPQPRNVGLKHFAVVALVSLILIGVFSAGTGDRTIRHGQAYFAVAAAFYLAVGRAQAFFPVRSTFWSCCAVPVVCVLAYLFSWFMSFPTLLVRDLPTVPVSSFLRILPITYIAVGIPATLAAYWRARHLHPA